MEPVSSNKCLSCGTLLEDGGWAPFSRITCPHCGEFTLVEDMVGKFQLLEIIVEGSFSTVYRASDLALGRDVALELFEPANSANHSLLHDLQSKASIIARLNHQHVVSVYSTGAYRNRFYVVTEMMALGSLSAMVLRDGALSEKDALDMTIRVVSGLQAAHQAGLLHGNIHPQYIQFSKPELAKIGNFGVDPLISQLTLPYLAPEILDGHPPDLRSDIYALGATLLFAMAGCAPIDVHKEAEGWQNPVADLPKLIPNVSNLTAGILRRMLSKDPAKRFQNYPELLQRLQSARDHLGAPGHAAPTPTVHAHAPVPVPASPKVTVSEPSTVNPLLVTLTVVPLVVAIALIGWFFRGKLAQRSAPEAASAVVAAKTTTALVKNEPAPVKAPPAKSAPAKPEKRASDRKAEPLASAEKHDNKPEATPLKKVSDGAITSTIPPEMRSKFAAGTYRFFNYRVQKYMSVDPTDSHHRLVNRQLSGAEQTWELIPIASGAYQIRSVATGKLIDMRTVPWTNTYLEVPNGKEAVVNDWIITTTEKEDYFRIISETGVGSLATNMTPGAQVELRNPNKKEVNWWKIEPVQAADAAATSGVHSDH